MIKMFVLFYAGTVVGVILMCILAMARKDD